VHKMSMIETVSGGFWDYTGMKSTDYNYEWGLVLFSFWGGGPLDHNNIMIVHMCVQGRATDRERERQRVVPPPPLDYSVPT
jgi:hypothetical protein